MAEWLDELERLEAAATPGLLHWDDEFAVIRTDPPDNRGFSTIVAGATCHECGVDDVCAIEWNKPEDRDLFLRLRNHARDLISAARRVAELEAIVAEQARLLSAADVAIGLVTKWAGFLYQCWLNKNSSVGAQLLALSGARPHYAPDTDGIHALWAQIREYRAAAAKGGGA